MQIINTLFIAPKTYLQGNFGKMSFFINWIMWSISFVSGVKSTTKMLLDVMEECNCIRISVNSSLLWKCKFVKNKYLWLCNLSRYEFSFEFSNRLKVRCVMWTWFKWFLDAWSSSLFHTVNYQICDRYSHYVLIVIKSVSEFLKKQLGLNLMVP